MTPVTIFTQRQNPSTYVRFSQFNSVYWKNSEGLS